LFQDQEENMAATLCFREERVEQLEEEMGKRKMDDKLWRTESQVS
jgi:hypothetical protein